MVSVSNNTAGAMGQTGVAFDGRADLAGFAAIAVGCAIGYLDFRFPAIAWRERHANLARLSDKLALRQSFIDTRPPG